MVIQPLAVARTRMLEGITMLRRTLAPTTPPRSLKMMTAGSFSPEAVSCKGYCEPLLLRTSRLHPNGLLPSGVIGPCTWHVKPTHGLVHVDNGGRVYAISFPEPNDCLPEVMQLVSVVCWDLLSHVGAASHANRVPRLPSMYSRYSWFYTKITHCEAVIKL